MNLNKTLADEAIDLAASAEDWRDAITQAGRLLERAGAATAGYTQAMIDSVVANGPYIVVAPGFAFAHARPSDDVKRTALSWLQLREPVRFGHEKNDPVSLVVALAATDAHSHSQAMAQLAKVVATGVRAGTVAELRAALDPAVAASQSTAKNLLLTVCSNGLGTSLFLKNTVVDVLDYWGWRDFVRVEATDTISAKGCAGQADAILTSGEIARTLGDVGVPVAVIDDFTSGREVDTALRSLYDLSGWE